MKKILLYSLFFCLGNNIVLASLIPADIKAQIDKHIIPTKDNINYYEKYYEKYQDTEAGPVTANLIWQGYHMMCNTEEYKKKEREYFKIFLNSFYDENHGLLDKEVINNKLFGLPNAVYGAWLELEEEYKGNISQLLQALLTDDTKLDDLLNSFDDL